MYLKRLNREAVFFDNESRTNTGKLSDKEYRVYLFEMPQDKYEVCVRHGRRGALAPPETLVGGATEDDAIKVFSARVDRQEKKKYRGKIFSYDENGEPTLVRTVGRNDISAHEPQLLTPIDVEQTADLAASGKYYLSRKYNGVRLTVEKTNDGIRGINKLGAYVSVPPEITLALKDFPQNFVADGEYIKAHGSWYVFDLISGNDIDLRSKSFFERLSATHTIFQSDLLPLPGIVLIDHATTLNDMKKMITQGVAEGWEGFVYAKIDAPYSPGRTQSMLKHKLVESVTVEIGKENLARSVQISMIDPYGKLFSVGNVHIPPNESIPEAGSFAEIEYAYASKRSILQQPIWIGKREDVTRLDCSFETLKYNKEVGRDTRFDSVLSR